MFIFEQKIGLFWRTIRHLRHRQITSRLLFIFKKKWRQILCIQWSLSKSSICYNQQFRYSVNFGPAREVNSFKFLNKEHEFQNEIDWNFDGFGKLWTYNLNYFEFLNCANVSTELGSKWIHNYISAIESGNVVVGWEPYPLSLRLVFWIRFLLNHNFSHERIVHSLKAQSIALEKQLEFHIMGNHLLENAMALVFTSVFFRDEKQWKKASKLLLKELDEQILSDGGHFELSPMYHSIILYRLLDVIQLLKFSGWSEIKDEINKCESVAGKMLSWLKTICYDDGNYPLFNDATIGIAPEPVDLLNYANFLKIQPIENLQLSSSGYRKLVSDTWILFIDVGQIGPDYIPGHAPADTLNFELSLNNKPIFVDPGVSSYEKGKRRDWERSTIAHNTVTVSGKNSSEVWSAFRVGNRAKCKVLHQSENSILAEHDGFEALGIIHRRKFELIDDVVCFQDVLIGTKVDAYANFHFFDSIAPYVISATKIKNENFIMEFEGSIDIKIKPYKASLGFNNLETRYKLSVKFNSELNTQVYAH